MDLSDPLPLVKAIMPKVPMIGKTVFAHTLGTSPTSKKWDLRTELTVNVLRSFVNGKPEPVSRTQNLTLKDPGIKGKIWVAKVATQIPSEDSLRQALFACIDELSESSKDYLKPEYIPVEAEWTGYRGGATTNSVELRISEQQKYAELMKEATSSTTILYLHGGAYYLLDPCSHRKTCAHLAKITQGRCYNVRYRLAPQAAFPAQLLDALHSYFSLLFPPPGALHAPVQPEHIVFAGDSAGGNLATVLMLTLLHMKRTSKTITFFGHEINMATLALPAGLALSSPWLDLTHSSPSCETNAQWDYLPSRSATASPRIYPEDSIWPPKPPAIPRKTLYADDGLITHPLVSPMICKKELWRGLPPIWMCVGDELLHDEGVWTAGQIARVGGKVQVEEYEAMPHCFAQIFENLDISRMCMDNWGMFIKSCVESPESIVSSGKRVFLKEASIESRVVDEFVSGELWSEEAVRNRMVEAHQQAINRPAGAVGDAMDGASAK